MVGFGNWIDTHGHLADERWEAQGPGAVADIIEDARQLGIGYFMQGGVGPEDWQRQLELKAKFDKHIGLCFGLHPYWVANHTEEECDEALDFLPNLLLDAVGLGELGLDFRPHIMKDSRELQLEVFLNQLELAEATNIPMVLHLVQAHEEALQVFDMWGIPKSKGLVHSFNSSFAKAEDFLKRGLSLSIGGPVCRPDNQRLRQAVAKIPLEALLVESDSPDQSPPAYQNQLNPPSSIWEVARTIGEIKKLDPTEILDISSANFRRLFNGHEFPTAPRN